MVKRPCYGHTVSLKEVIKNMTNLPIKIYIIKKCGSTKEEFLFPFDFDFKNNL